jgi:hypothetical protein
MPRGTATNTVSADLVLELELVVELVVLVLGRLSSPTTTRTSLRLTPVRG